MRAIAICLPLLLSLHACDSEVSIAPTGGTGGGGDDPGSAGSSGEGGAKICTSSNSCGFSAWCDFPTDSCAGEGVCVAIPTECPADCDGVCSCDGAFYCNACMANEAGMDVSASGDCPMPDVEYSVHSLPTDVPRLALFKADYIRDLCIEITVAGIPGPGSFGVEVTPADWQIEAVVASDHVSDCQIGIDGLPEAPQGESVSSLAAMGTLVLSLPEYPCGVSSDMMLQFMGGLDWVDELEIFQWEYENSGIPCDP